MNHRYYFNSIAPKWDTIYKHDDRLQSFMTDFGIEQGDCVIDIGAGTGRLTGHLLSIVGQKGRVIAEDISEDMLKIARQSLQQSNCDFTCSDVHRLPFRDNSADKIVCFSVFPHIHQPERAINEMRRVLRKNGKLLVLHTCCSRKLNKMHAGLDAIVKHDRLPLSGELVDMFSHNGFDALKVAENPELYWVEVIKKA